MRPTSKVDVLFGLCDPEFRLVTSPWVTPRALFFVRLTLAFYAIVAGVFDLFYHVFVLKDESQYYAYFTRMSYIAITIYLAAAALNTWFFDRSLQKARQALVAKPSHPFQTSPRPLRFLYMFWWTTVAAYPPMVTTVFWFLLSKGNSTEPGYHLWSNISFHAMNTLFVLVELVLCRTQLLWIYAPFLPVVGLLYMAEAELVHATQGFFTYPFLDPEVVGNKVPLYVVAVAIVSVASFAIMWGISRLRDSIRPTAKGIPPSMSEKVVEGGEKLCITISKESITIGHFLPPLRLR